MQYSNLENSPSIKDLFSLKNKNSLVIGGAGLLGSHMSLTLAELGSNIIIASRDLKKCSEITNLISAKYNNIKITAHSVDITNEKSLDELHNFVLKEYKSLDILINSGTSNKKNNLESITFDDWDYDVNVTLCKN